MKKLIVLTALLGAAALPAPASARVLPDVISIHADEYDFANELYGSVESKKAKCERNRTVKLFHDATGSGFNEVFETTTDFAGQYRISAGDLGESLVPDGDYFARVVRVERGRDVCRRDDSRVIEIQLED